jgi:chromosome segregation ATPase
MVFLNNEFTVLDRELLTQNDNLGVHDRDIDALRTALDALRRDIGPMDERVHSQDARLRELEEEVKKHNDHTDELLKLLHREIEENDSKIS